MASIAAENILELIEFDGFAKLHFMNTFAIATMKEMCGDMKKAQQAVESSLDKEKAEHEETKRRLTSLPQKLKTANERYGRALFNVEDRHKVLSARSKCHHCGSEFSCHIKQEEPEDEQIDVPGFTLRCGSCWESFAD